MDDIFQFEGFRLDRRGLFRRDDRGVFAPIAIGSRALDVLGVLVGRAGELVPRNEIIALVWPAIVVEDNNLNLQVAALRRLLDHGRLEGSCIQTVARRGYRFTAAVTESRQRRTRMPRPFCQAQCRRCRISRRWRSCHSKT